MVAERAQKGLNLPSSSSSFNKLHNEDPYDVEKNKTGYIRLSSADNQLSSDLIKAKFDSINWSKFNKNLLFGYPRCGGETSTQASAATFINRFCRQGMPPIAADELTIVPGITTALDLLSQILFDPGDFILSPAPYYYRFLNDFGERGLVHIQLVPALSEGSQRTELSVERFEAAYEETHEKMGKVRAVIIVNPQNPEGCYNTLAEIGPIVEWALKKNLFILLDEIYDLCIYDEEPGKPFRSAVALFQTQEQKQKLIWLWGLSKNFSLPGLRAGVVYSPNETVRTAVGRFMMHHQPNCMTQFVMREFLDDYAWFQHTYHPENLRRLRQARDLVLGFLDRLDVPYLKPRAGFFVMADFSKFLDKQSIEAERRLCKQFVQKKVLLTAGETVKAPKPGWFRIVFSSVDATTLEEALRRIKEAIQMAGGGEKK